MRSARQNKIITVEGVSLALSRMGQEERNVYAITANCKYDCAGTTLPFEYHEYALANSLIYRCTGRLRPVVLKLLTGRL